MEKKVIFDIFIISSFGCKTLTRNKTLNCNKIKKKKKEISVDHNFFNVCRLL